METFVEPVRDALPPAAFLLIGACMTLQTVMIHYLVKVSVETRLAEISRDLKQGLEERIERLEKNSPHMRLEIAQISLEDFLRGSI